MHTHLYAWVDLQEEVSARRLYHELHSASIAVLDVPGQFNSIVMQPLADIHFQTNGRRQLHHLSMHGQHMSIHSQVCLQPKLWFTMSSRNMEEADVRTKECSCICLWAQGRKRVINNRHVSQQQ